MAAMDFRKVFIIHGHDSLAMYELRDFLKRLGIQPVVLSLEDDAGLTIKKNLRHTLSHVVLRSLY